MPALVMPTAAAFALFALVGLAGAGAVALALFRWSRVAPDIDPFLTALGSVEDPLDQPFMSRVVGTALGSLARRMESLLPRQHLASLEHQLTRAGLAGKRRAGEQLARQLGFAATGALVAGLLVVTAKPSPRMTILILSLMVGMGFTLPAARLKKAVRERADAIFKDLPDIIDMLAIAVGAGSGFEAALHLVCQRFNSPLADELRLTLKEMELGLPRREALKQLKERVDLDVVRIFVLALLQADALGIPLGRVLKAQSTEIRARRRAWAREKAAKLPVKILFPLVLFIFPPILALVLGPAGFSLAKLG